MNYLNRSDIILAAVFFIAQWNAYSQENQKLPHQMDGCYLGITVKEYSDKEAKIEGVIIETVDKTSPADKAGLAKGDLIEKFNGVRMRTAQELKQFLSKKEPGDNAIIYLYRKNANDKYEGVKINLQLGYLFGIKIGGMNYEQILMIEKIAAPMEDTMFENISKQTKKNNKVYIGVELKALDKDMKEKMKFKGTNGLLIESVKKDGIADKSGLKAGDIIIKAGNEKVQTAEDLQNILKNNKDGKKIKLSYFRKNDNSEWKESKAELLYVK